MFYCNFDLYYVLYILATMIWLSLVWGTSPSTSLYPRCQNNYNLVNCVNSTACCVYILSCVCESSSKWLINSEQREKDSVSTSVQALGYDFFRSEIDSPTVLLHALGQDMFVHPLTGYSNSLCLFAPALQITYISLLTKRFATSSCCNLALLKDQVTALSTGKVAVWWRKFRQSKA